eukprot:CAMPEP_0172448170 /NCGR_PEP_ID=MMETSP1065-20121228/7238_1 /TAXON_ID=265537 /ORGANISM="Amphiprora paludosa, Strain CCMP125" /LENGTH=467 /DNA_ID=CAMNT_0013199585 /DNA_START=80 /DNA_END=1483 /DNA_ORIENTATION=+
MSDYHCAPKPPAGETHTVQEAVQELHRLFLHVEAMDMKNQEALIMAYSEKLNEVGVPVDRFYRGATVTHPLIRVLTMKWEKPDIVSSKPYTRQGNMDTRELIENGYLVGDEPMVRMAMGEPFVRINVNDPNLPKDCQWMKDDGYVELYGLPSISQKKQVDGKMEGGFTWTTKRPEGFSDDHLAILKGHLLDLCTVARYHVKDYTMQTLLKIYLGDDAGRRVHHGQIERGDGLIIRSVVWFSDIRGFTKMSGELSRGEVMEVINGVFEVTERVTRKYGGQILKFMGDGIMVFFSDNTTSFQRDSFTAGEKKQLDDAHGAKLCRNARHAAEEFQRELCRLKIEREAQGLRGASVGVGLHYGDVSYGNVGGLERLDFTVIGPTVNLASRIESKCSSLSAQVLASSDFVLLDRAPQLWNTRGKHELKGVKEPMELYELQSMCGEGMAGADISSLSLFRSPGAAESSTSLNP